MSVDRMEESSTCLPESVLSYKSGLVSGLKAKPELMVGIGSRTFARDLSVTELRFGFGWDLVNFISQ